MVPDDDMKNALSNCTRDFLATDEDKFSVRCARQLSTAASGLFCSA